MSSARELAFALRLGEKTVTEYETRQEAEDAMAWYIATYGAPSEPLTVAETRTSEGSA